MNILILGASGFIGSAVARRLSADGHAVTGLGRNLAAMRRRMAFITWREADLATLVLPASWQAHLDGIDVVVNAAGALQDGARDDLAAVQDRAMQALYVAAQSRVEPPLVVQVSARTDGPGSHTAFLATKRRADEALKASGLPHVVLRPALVLGRNAHGGSALLRALAAMPCVTPLIHAESPVATVGLDDVAAAVSDAVAGTIPAGSDLELAAPRPVALADLVALHRSWLGLAPARRWSVPLFAAIPVVAAADMAGRLGWRAPLRSTAMRVMQGGVTAAASAEAPGRTLRDAGAVLAANPAGVQDLWFARLYLLKPLVVVCLSVFWLASGLVPFWNFAPAYAHFSPLMPPGWAAAAVIATCLADILLGAAVLARKHARRAMQGMVVLAAAYLAAATLVEPSLWLDPLGPLVKVLPSVVLALVGLAILDER
ncbi:SDR family oxidoreductase [Rhizobium sp. TRM95111]|uniref:SDR family oxidoreductase n=1 Tax=Rhizobium alarense TaxID=2846851 RepID=UPI001F1A123C|nr:SDR family oxidoreductase [Rhizobium alarense]MCF3640561.1 SDR family oxidoreductase [Rhizobium alarense]